MKRLLKRLLNEVIEQAFVKFIGETFEMVIDTGFAEITWLWRGY